MYKFIEIYYLYLSHCSVCVCVLFFGFCVQHFLLSRKNVFLDFCLLLLPWFAAFTVFLFVFCDFNCDSDFEQLISGQLCKRYCHAKCTGITGCAVVAALDRLKALRRSYPNCRKRDINFFKLFTKTRNSFL